MLDNLSAHMGPEVTRWLDHPKRARWHLHFTPTSSSWLNLVERWFKELTDRRLRRGSFSSVPALVDAIETWTEHWNDDPKPFIWHKTADEIIAKARRGRQALTRAKSTTDHSGPRSQADGRRILALVTTIFSAITAWMLLCHDLLNQHALTTAAGLLENLDTPPNLSPLDPRPRSVISG